jgi:hypothetical protein
MKKIGIIDSGVDGTHADLLDVLDGSLSKCFHDGCSVSEDESGHGTAVAGLATATTNNYFGVAAPGGGWGEPYPNETLVNLNVWGAWDPDGEQIIAAIEYATKNQIPVLNMSFGTSDRDIWGSLFGIRNALKNAFVQGVLPVASTGNRVGGGESYPAAFDRFVLGVGHVLKDGTRNDWNAGYFVDVVAPGGAEIVTTCAGGGYHVYGQCGYFTGTSASSPLAAGIAALLWSLEPSLINEDIMHVLPATALDYGPAGWDSAYGWGLVRADSAMRFVSCDHVLQTGSALGHNDYEDLGGRVQEFRNVTGINNLADSWRITWAHLWKFSQTVPFDAFTFEDPPHGKAWPRGRLCSTWKDTLWYDLNWEANWADTTNVGINTMDMHGYVYQVWNADSTEFLGWYPFNPRAIGAQPLNWRYAYIVPAETSRRVPDGPEESTVLVSDMRLWSTPAPDRTAIIHFILPKPVRAAVEVFDVSGRLVRAWPETPYPAGRHRLTWDGRFDNGDPASAGVYPIRFVATDRVVTGKVVLR